MHASWQEGYDTGLDIGRIEGVDDGIDMGWDRATQLIRTLSEGGVDAHIALGNILSGRYRGEMVVCDKCHLPFTVLDMVVHERECGKGPFR